jgi:hypothetical protein
MTGPGKYDDLCTLLRAKAEATAAIVVIIGGNKGQGFSCQAPLEVTLALPKLLRAIADEIEATTKQ